jgi:hypothetical protein
MSTFMSYSTLGSLVAGFQPLAVRDRGMAWRDITDSDCNTPAWLNDTVVIYQQGAYSNEGRSAYLATTDGRRFKRQASRLFAGGNRWVASHEAPDPDGVSSAVLHDGEGRTLWGDRKSPTDPVGGQAGPSRIYWGAGQHGVGRDGTLAYCPRYHQGRGVIIEDAVGNQLNRTDGIPVTSCSVIDRNAIGVFSAADIMGLWFWNGSTWTRYPLAFPCYEGQIVRWKSDIYVLEGSEQIAVHKIDDSTKGWVFGLSGKGYNAVGWEDESNDLYIAWSENAPATKGAVKETKLVGSAQPWPLPVFEPPRTTRQIWRGVDGSKSDGSVVTQLGNFAWGQPADKRLVFEGMPWASAVTQKLLTLYLSTENTPPVDSTIQEAKKRRCGIAVYCDAFLWTSAAEKIAQKCLTEKVPIIRVVQAYLVEDESAGAAIARVKRQVDIVKGKPDKSGVGLMQRADLPSSKTKEATLREFTHRCENLITAQSSIVFQAIFGARRPGVVAAVMSYLNTAISNMRTGLPPALPGYKPPPPKPEPPTEPDMPCVIDGYSYERWVELGAKIDRRYREVNKSAGGQGDQPPAGSDVNHNTWRVLAEGMSEAEMLARIDPAWQPGMNLPDFQ